VVPVVKTIFRPQYVKDRRVWFGWGSRSRPGHSGPWVGARVPFLESPILRSSTSIVLPAVLAVSENFRGSGAGPQIKMVLLPLTGC